MALGARFNKKFDLNKNVSLSSVYSDISMSGTNTLQIQGGTGHKQTTLFNFTVPSRPSFGDAELEGMSANFYIREIDVFPVSGTSLTGVAAHRVSVEDITEGGNSILAKPSVISTSSGNFNFIRDNFDGSKAITTDAKNYKLEVVTDKIVMLDEPYMAWDNFLDFATENCGSASEDYYKNWKQTNPYPTGPKYIVPITETSNGLSFGTQKTGAILSHNRELGPYQEGETYYKHIKKFMAYGTEIVQDSSLDADSASEYSTIFDYVHTSPEMKFTRSTSGTTSGEELDDYWISSAKFSTENVVSGGRSIKIHNKWAWNYNGKITHDSVQYDRPVLLGTIPGTEYRQPRGAIGTGVVADLNIGIGQPSVDRQEVKMGFRIPSSPTALSSFRKGEIEKFDDMFIDFDIYFEKLAPAYRNSRINNNTSGYKTPSNDNQFPNPNIAAIDNSANRGLFYDGNQATLRRSVTWTLGERPPKEDENLYDYVQDNMLWFCKVTEVDVAHDSDAGDGGAVHKFRCASPDTKLQSAVKAQAVITITGNATIGNTIQIIDAESSATTQTYTAASTESAASRQFRASGTVSQIRTSLKTCIEHANGHNGKIICIEHPTDAGVLILRQYTAGTAGNTTITENVANLTKTDFTGGAAAGTTTLSNTIGSDVIGFGGRATFDDLTDYPSDGFNGHTLMFINSTNSTVRRQVRHIIDFDKTTGAITLDDSLGDDVSVNDIFIVWSGNYRGATTNDGSDIPNITARPISRKNFAMGAYLKTSKHVEVSEEHRTEIGIHYYDASNAISGGLFLWPPTCDVHAGMPKRTSATAGTYSSFFLESLPEKTHVNINMNFLCQNEGHRGSTQNPYLSSAGNYLGMMKWLPSSNAIRDTNIGDADKNKVMFEALEDVDVGISTDGYTAGGNTREFFNCKLQDNNPYAGASRLYDDSTEEDDWTDDISPSDNFPQYFTLWFTNYPNNARMDRVESQTEHVACDGHGGAASTSWAWQEWHIQCTGGDATKGWDDLLTDRDDIESIIYLNSIALGNVQPMQYDSSWIDKEHLTANNINRSDITIPAARVNHLNTEVEAGSEEFDSSFICIGFENSTDITAPDISDTDSTTNQKYLLWNGYESPTDDAIMNSYGGWNWGDSQHTDQLAMMYSNTLERLGDWDKDCSFNPSTSKTKLKFPRGLSEGTGTHDDLDHNSHAYAPDGFKQKGFWAMKWHPRNIGIQDQSPDTRNSATTFTTNNLASNYDINDFFNGWEIYWITGNNAGTTSTVTDYTSAGMITHSSTSGVTATSDTFDLYPTWEKRECPWASTKIVKIDNKSTFKVAKSKVLDGWSSDKYIIYRMGTGASSAFRERGVGFNTPTAKKYYKSGVSITGAPIEGDDSYYTVQIDASAVLAEDGSTALLTDANLAELWICPEKYWLTLNVTNNTYVNSVNRAGGRKSFSSICVTEAPAVGTTFNELLYSDAQSYTNKWDITSSVSPDQMHASGLILDRDYGFGALEESEETVNTGIRGKGILGYENIIQKSKYNKIDIDGLVSTDSIEEGDKVTIAMIPVSPMDSHLITIDSRSYSSGNKPYMIAKYRDKLPTISNFNISPNKENPFYPEISWSSGDKDAWYGFLIITDENIYNQYDNAIIHLPLNEVGTHGTAATTPTEKISGLTTIISGPTYDLEGLAGYSLNFDGTNDYIRCGTPNTNINTAATNDATATATSEMSIVAHIVPDSGASDDRYIVSQEDTNGRKFSINLNSSNQVVAKVYRTDSDYVGLTSSSIVPTNGETPTNIILTVDTTLTSGNIKLFVNGKLEDSSGVALSTGTTNNWQTGATMQSANGYVVIGNSSHSSVTLDRAFDGKIEEIVIYSKCIYPVVPADGNYLFTKPVSELQSGESLASSKSNVARLFIKDYHNIRGSSTSEVATSPQRSWRKAAFALDTT